MRATRGAIAVLAIITLWGCGRVSSPPPQATVQLKDGSSFSGAVTNSSTEQISVQASTGETRTYPMSQVASVQYAQSDPAAATPPVSSAPAPVAIPVVNQAPPPVAQPVEEIRTIPAGTTLQVRNNEAIDSQTAQPGQTFSAVVNRDVVDSQGRVAIAHGSNATLVVTAATDQGKLQGQSELMVDVSAVTVNGKRYRLETNDVVEKGREGVGVNKRTGAFAGGGAAVGGIIGAIAGGGKGAAIGALAGGGAGTAAQGLTRGKAVRIAPETLLTFQLEAPVRIREIR